MESKHTRLEFFYSLGRFLFLAVFSLAGGTLFFKKRLDFSLKHTCHNRFICRGCSKLANCVLPQALSARKELRENRENRDE